jgi:hypothetical protein
MGVARVVVGARVNERVYWSDIKLRRLASGRVQLLDPVVFYVYGNRFTVPAGRICDLASQPEFWPLPNKLRGAPGAILHDEFYSHPESYPNVGRHQADWFARLVWDADPDMGSVWSAIYWAGVRFGGRMAWSRARA